MTGFNVTAVLLEPIGDHGASLELGLAGSGKPTKETSRDRMLSAATSEFCARGYFDVSVEDIATSAGVSRMTFYRHFSGKAEIASELFRLNSQAAMPRLMMIANLDFRDRTVVEQWITGLFDDDRDRRQLLRVFSQANADEAGFTQSAQRLIDELIVGLGQVIPAFALDPEAPSDRRRWIEAWLVLYEILDQGNHAARGAGLATDPLMPGILADRFLRFVLDSDIVSVR